MAYKIKDNVTREELIAAVEALNPFYGFGEVLATAMQENGHSWVDLFAGKPECDSGLDEQPSGPTADFENITDDGCIVGVNAGWQKIPATYCGPIITAGDFFAARDAFLACIEDTPNEADQKGKQ